MGHGKFQVLVQDKKGDHYRYYSKRTIPVGYTLTTKKDGFSIYDENGEILSQFWNYRKVPFEDTL